MADEPSPRAIWNVKVLLNFLLFFIYVGFLLAGVIKGALTYEQAMQYLGTTALGGGMTWMAMK
jgi:hypothetical protein